MYHEIDIVGFFEKGCAVSHEQKNGKEIALPKMLFDLTQCYQGNQISYGIIHSLE